ncbi:polynucleotide kinase/ligase [Spodoptera litura granulovirus]|uniref:Polynucleotide kinase/ligase n=1 Tax=Spodoptera litura granulovirus TaxID=359919 RepID=A5IZW0_9BBAC|nr:polynucleotide kinase/ligase [Spodoptera litura granulovirus]ABQ52051.1 polynucleotide kinase/ligase [Spodoptera litura granulovirus]
MLDVSRYLREHGIGGLKKRYKIRTKVYHDEELVVLNYEQNEKCKTDTIVMECRGLILNSTTFDVVSRSFDRFFVYDRYMHNFRDGMKAVEKIDGSLVKIYYHHGAWHPSTRGTAFAENRINGKVLFRSLIIEAIGKDFNNVCESYLPKEYTHIFELTSCHNKIICVHTSEPKLWYLMSRHNQLGTYIHIYDLPFCLYPKSFQFNSIDQCREVIEQCTDEGVVMYDMATNAPLYKIKNYKYMNLHYKRNKSNSKKKTAEVVINNDHDEYLTLFPDQEHIYRPYIQALEYIQSKKLQKHMDSLLNMDPLAFAANVSALPWRHLVYECKKKSHSGKSAIETFDSLPASERCSILVRIVNNKVD